MLLDIVVARIKTELGSDFGWSISKEPGVNEIKVCVFKPGFETGVGVDLDAFEAVKKAIANQRGII